MAQIRSFMFVVVVGHSSRRCGPPHPSQQISICLSAAIPGGRVSAPWRSSSRRRFLSSRRSVAPRSSRASSRVAGYPSRSRCVGAARGSYAAAPARWPTRRSCPISPHFVSARGVGKSSRSPCLAVARDSDAAAPSRRHVRHPWPTPPHDQHCSCFYIFAPRPVFA